MTKSSDPKVTIVIPVYNGANYMRQAINSGLAQTYQNIEIIVINDGSTDGGETDRIAKSYGSRIRYYTKENAGVSTALNYGIDKMSGEYFSWLSHDDMYTPDKVEKEMALAQKKGNNSIIYCGYSAINEAGTNLKNYHLPKNITENIKCAIALETTYTLSGSTMLIPRRNFARCGMFNPDLKFMHNYDLLLRFIQQGIELAYLDECLVLSRLYQEKDERIGGQEVALEKDRLHSKAINTLTVDEVSRYIEGDSSRLESLYKKYAANGYVSTVIDIKSLRARYLAGSNNGYIDRMAWLKTLCIEKNESKNLDLLCKPISISKPVLVFYCNVWTFGGSERVVSLLMEHFRKSYQIVLISSYIEGEKGFALPTDVVHIKAMKTESLTLAEQIAALAKAVNASIFIGNPNIMIDFLPVYYLLKHLGIKTVALNHYFYYLPFQVKWRWLNEIAEKRHEALQHADVVVWLTSFSSVMWRRSHPNVARMPNPNTYEPVGPHTYPQEKVVLAVGRFYDTIKRIDKILSIFKMVYTKDPEAKLVLVGGYDEKTMLPAPTNKLLSDFLKELSFPEGVVRFEGEKKNVPYYYEQASVLLLTSECEGFPMVLTEAGVYGVPMIIYYYPGCEDLITNGENGFAVPQDDEKAASESILRLLNDPELWRNMSQNAQRLAKRYEKTAVMARWERLFQILQSESDVTMNERLKSADLSPNKADTEHYLCIASDFLEKQLLKELIPGEDHTDQPSFEPSGKPICDSLQDADYCNEVLKMRKTLSWKITFPLRIVRKTLISIKNRGVRTTARLIRSRLKKK